MSKHRFLTHSFATDVATRSLAHRALSLALTRTLSVAFVGASITLLAACGSTAADLAKKQADEEARIEASKPAEFGYPTSEETPDRPEGQGGIALTLEYGTPFANPGDESNRDLISPFTATGITITGKTGEERGVSEDNAPATTTPVGGYTFADLTLSRFSPTPIGKAEANNAPFLLIWQFANAETTGAKDGQTWNDWLDDEYSTTVAEAKKARGNGKFIAPGISLFRYTLPEPSGDDDPFDGVAAPANSAAYLERMLEDFKPHNVVDDGEEFEHDVQKPEHRPIPYAYDPDDPAVERGITQLNDRVSRVFLGGSSTFWAGAVEQTAYGTDGDTEESVATIPAYEVELVFPKRYATNWALQYSGFILMRAFYDTGSLATGAPRSYINLFTYTRKDKVTDMEGYLLGDDGYLATTGKNQAKAYYTSTFSGWGVAAQNPNKHYYLYDNIFRLTATFNKDGSGTVEGTIEPEVRETGGTVIKRGSPLTDGESWEGRTIKLEKVQWTGWSSEFKGIAKVLDADGEVVSAYNSYDDGHADSTGDENKDNFKGKFAGPRAEELVAEIKLQSSEITDPTILGGVSGHRYDDKNIE